MENLLKKHPILHAIFPRTEWLWSRDNASLHAGFTDWGQEYNKVIPSRCLFFSMETAHEGHHWAHTSCIEWMYFTCQLPGQAMEEVQPSKAVHFIGPKRCLETKNAAGEVDVDDEHCYRFVKLQYTREKAEAFCREELGGSLARVQGEQRATFERLLFSEKSIADYPVRRRGNSCSNN